MATTDQTLLGRVQDALVEPRNGGQSWTSDLWSRPEVLSAANLRQNRFLFDTLPIVTSDSVSVLATQHRFSLPATWLRTVMVVWTGTVVRELMRSNSFEADHLLSTWEATDATYPLVYFEEETATATIQIAPAPTGNGTLTIYFVPTATEMNGNGDALTLPDDLSHAVKYGLLADLLGKDGRGQDRARADYCEQRVDLARVATEIILKGWA